MKYFFRTFIFILVTASSCSKNGSSYVNNPGAPDYLHNRPVGASARELLSPVTYQSLKVEILYMTGFAPDAGAINHMQSFLESVLNKPAGITIVTKEVSSSSSTVMSINDIIDLEKNHRTVFTTGNQFGVCLVYTNGNYTDNSTLGIAYRNSSAAIFGKKIRDNSGAIGQTSRTKLEATVMEHELGHLLGLVDLGSPVQTNHEDAAHKSHCNNSNCLMYYASETTDILGFLLTGAIPSLDVNCKADLQANGGR